MGSRSKLCLSDSLGRGDPLGQRLESLNGQGLSSDSLDGISRQLLGSLGNLPENDPVLRDMLASMASAPPALGDNPDGENRTPWLLPSPLVSICDFLQAAPPTLVLSGGSCRPVPSWACSAQRPVSIAHITARYGSVAGAQGGAQSRGRRVLCAGRGLANMDIGQGPWGSLGDMTSLSNRGGSLLTDLDPARVSTLPNASSIISRSKPLSLAVWARWTFFSRSLMARHGKGSSLLGQLGQLSATCPCLKGLFYPCVYLDIVE